MLHKWIMKKLEILFYLQYLGMKSSTKQTTKMYVRSFSHSTVQGNFLPY